MTTHKTPAVKRRKSPANIWNYERVPTPEEVAAGEALTRRWRDFLLAYIRKVERL